MESVEDLLSASSSESSNYWQGTATNTGESHMSIRKRYSYDSRGRSEIEYSVESKSQNNSRKYLPGRSSLDTQYFTAEREKVRLFDDCDLTSSKSRNLPEGWCHTDETKIESGVETDTDGQSSSRIYRDSDTSGLGPSADDITPRPTTKPGGSIISDLQRIRRRLIFDDSCSVATESIANETNPEILRDLCAALPNLTSTDSQQKVRSYIEELSKADQGHVPTTDYVNVKLEQLLYSLAEQQQSAETVPTPSIINQILSLPDSTDPAFLTEQALRGGTYVDRSDPDKLAIDQQQQNIKDSSFLPKHYDPENVSLDASSLPEHDKQYSEEVIQTESGAIYCLAPRCSSPCQDTDMDSPFLPDPNFKPLAETGELGSTVGAHAQQPIDVISPGSELEQLTFDPDTPSSTHSDGGTHTAAANTNGGFSALPQHLSPEQLHEDSPLRPEHLQGPPSPQANNAVAEIHYGHDSINQVDDDDDDEESEEEIHNDPCTDHNVPVDAGTVYAGNESDTEEQRDIRRRLDYGSDSDVGGVAEGGGGGEQEHDSPEGCSGTEEEDDDDEEEVSQSENAEADQHLEEENISEVDEEEDVGSEHSGGFTPGGEDSGAYQNQGVPLQPPDGANAINSWVLNIDPNPNPEDDQPRLGDGANEQEQPPQVAAARHGVPARESADGGEAVNHPGGARAKTTPAAASKAGGRSALPQPIQPRSNNRTVGTSPAVQENAVQTQSPANSVKSTQTSLRNGVLPEQDGYLASQTTSSLPSNQPLRNNKHAGPTSHNVPMQPAPSKGKSNGTRKVVKPSKTPTVQKSHQHNEQQSADRKLVSKQGTSSQQKGHNVPMQQPVQNLQPSQKTVKHGSSKKPVYSAPLKQLSHNPPVQQQGQNAPQRQETQNAFGNLYAHNAHMQQQVHNASTQQQVQQQQNHNAPMQNQMQQQINNAPMQQQQIQNAPMQQQIYSAPMQQQIHNAPMQQQQIHNAPMQQQLHNVPMQQYPGSGGIGDIDLHDFSTSTQTQQQQQKRDTPVTAQREKALQDRPQPVYPVTSDLHGLDLSPIRSEGSGRERFLPSSPGASSVVEKQDGVEGEMIGSYDMSSVEQIRQHLHGILSHNGAPFLADSEVLLHSDVGNLSSLPPLDPSDRFPDSHLDSMLSFTTKYLAGGKPTDNPGDSMFAENCALRECLEKERYRRKHCEGQIKQLQAKILELQQQLAVAVSTDRKKDNMITQLDKTLAKLVDGWRQKEGEQKQSIQKLQQENEEYNNNQQQQQKALSRLEQELAGAVSRLAEAQAHFDASERGRRETEEAADRDRKRMMEALETDRERLRHVEAERGTLREECEKLSNQVMHMKQFHEEERENWEDKEREYLQKIDQITENHLTTVEQGKEQLSRQAADLEAAKSLLTGTQRDYSQLQIELDTAMREKESLKVQMGLMEAKMENTQRKMLTDLKADLEKQMSERVSEVSARARSTEEQLIARHKHQMLELSERHTSELEEQFSRAQEEAARKQDRYEDVKCTLETRLAEVQQELAEQRRSYSQLKGQREDVSARLQTMMQAHCNETLRLLANGNTVQTSFLNSFYANASLPGKSDQSEPPAQTEKEQPLTNQDLEDIIPHPGSSHTPTQDNGDIMDEEDANVDLSIISGISNLSNVPPSSSVPFSQYTSARTELASLQQQYATNTRGGPGSRPENFAGTLPFSVATQMEEQRRKNTAVSKARTEHMHSLLQTNNVTNCSGSTISSSGHVTNGSGHMTNSSGHMTISSGMIMNSNAPIDSSSLSSRVSAVPGSLAAFRFNAPTVSSYQQPFIQPQLNSTAMSSVAAPVSGHHPSAGPAPSTGSAHRSSPARKSSPAHKSSPASIVLHAPVQLDGFTHTGGGHESPHTPRSRSTERSQHTANNSQESYSEELTDHRTAFLANMGQGGQNVGGLDYSSMSDRFDQHENRQHELQHFIRKLLHRSPGSPNEEEEEPVQDMPKAPPTPAPPTKAPPKRASVKAQPTKATTSSNPAFKQTTVAEDDRSGLSPQQVSEISRLLHRYQQQSTAEPSHGEEEDNDEQQLHNVLAYLRDVQQERMVSDDVADPTRDAPSKPETSKTAKHKQVSIKTPSASDHRPIRTQQHHATARPALSTSSKPTTTRKVAKMTTKSKPASKTTGAWK